MAPVSAGAVGVRLATRGRALEMTLASSSRPPGKAAMALAGAAYASGRQSLLPKHRLGESAQFPRSPATGSTPQGMVEASHARSGAFEQAPIGLHFCSVEQSASRMQDTSSPSTNGQQSWFRQGPYVPHSRSRVQ